MNAQIIIKPMRILSAEDAALYVNGEDNLKRLVKSKWLFPLKGKQRGMDYDIKALDVALDRVTLEGWPGL